MKKYITNDKLSMKEYHNADGVGNSSLLAFEESPARYVWDKKAPKQPGSSKASDLGTAIHSAILEPTKFKTECLLSPTKGRNTAAFDALAAENPDKTVLVESEFEQIKVIQKSANAHPAFAKYINQEFDAESSIFVTCPHTGLLRKIRIDMNFAQYGADYIGDLKSSRLLSDWRSTQRWKNPLFAYNYGHTAAYYLETASLFYGRQINTYLFFVVQTTVEMGKYPVDVIEITRDELAEYGFIERVEINLEGLANCKDFAVNTRFPDFGIDIPEIEITTNDTED